MYEIQVLTSKSTGLSTEVFDKLHTTHFKASTVTSTKLYNRRDDFSFETVNYPHHFGDELRSSTY